MFRQYQRSWLAPLAVFAVLAIESPTAFAQTPAQFSDQALVALTEFQPSNTASQPQATPEQIGDAMMARKRYQAAIEAYMAAPRGSAKVLGKLGIAYQMMHSLQEASRCDQASLKLNPRNASVLNNLGTVYDALRDYRAAESLYGKALKVDAQSALIRKNLGTALLAEHKYKKGWELYQAALAIDPHIFDRSYMLRVDNPTTVQERGAMNYYMAKGCLRAGQNDRAIEYLRKALNEGFVSTRRIVADSEFADLRGVPAFEQLLDAQSAP